MKYFQRVLIVLVVLGCAAGYFLWPYFEIRRFAAAVNRKDTETVKRMVDFDDLRASLKTVFVNAMVLTAVQQGGPQVDRETVRGKVQEFIEGAQGKALLDQLMTPDALATMMTSNQKDGKQVPMTWRNEEWRSPWEFRVQDTESEGFLNMKLTGNGWKVTGLEIPESDLHKFMAKQGPAAPRPRMQAP